jgi:type IV pilus assembly protein PilM
MVAFGKKRGLLVGLDVGSSAVKVMTLAEKKRGSYAIESLGLVPLPPEAIVEGQIIDPPAVADAIRKLMDQAGVRSRRVAFSVAGSAVFVKRVSVPATADRAELHESILWEAEQYLPFSREEVLIDYQVLETTSSTGQIQAVIVALKRDFAQMYLDALHQGRVEPVVLDIDAFAVQNAYELNYPELTRSQTVVALMNVGATKTNINIVQGTEPLFVRDAMVGMRSLTELVRTEFNLTYDQAELAKRGRYELRMEQIRPYFQQVFQDFGREITKTFRFFKQNFQDIEIRRVLLSGGGALTPGFKEFVQQTVGAPTELMDPTRALDTSAVDPEFLEEQRPALAVVVGLALRRE